MYTHRKIVECLRGLIGFGQSYNNDILLIDKDLQTSYSDLFVDRLHPLFTYENILSVTKHFDKEVVRAWNSTTLYMPGDIAKSGSTYYRALKESTNRLVSVTTYWLPTTLFSGYLRKVYDQACVNLVRAVFTKKKINEVAKTLLTDTQVYEGQGNLADKVIKAGRFVGFKIRIRYTHTVVDLQEIGLQLTQAQNPMLVYLFHSESNDPVKIISYSHNNSYTLQWVSPTSEIILDKTTGFYYLGYFENDLTGQAIDKTMTFKNRQACYTCGPGAGRDAALYEQWNKYIDIQPFYLSNYDTPEIWDEQDELYISDSNFGLNMRIAVRCEISEVLCRNRNVLIDALGHQLTVDLLKEMSFSLRVNPAQLAIASLAVGALDNQENKAPGEKALLEEAIKAVSLDFSNISKVCLPCDRPVGITQTSVWR